MTPEEIDAAVRERDFLRNEKASLVEQLKLLGRAEHALTRSRREANLQLDRVRRLAAFSLQITGADETEDVLSAARQAMLDLFAVDDVGILCMSGCDRAVRYGGETRPVDTGTWTLLNLVDGPGLSSADTSIAVCLLDAVRHSGQGVTVPSAPRVVLWVPLRSAHGAEALLVAWSSRSAAHHRDVPRPDLLPFVELFANHATRALDNARLKAQLRQQGTELASINSDLLKSVRDLERTQAQLVQAQKLEALGRLAGGIAHDFNNLLTVILSHADLARGAVESSPEAFADLDVIVDATKRAAEITRRLLAFGRQQENQVAVVDLNAVTTDLSRMLKRLIGDDVVLQLELNPRTARVSADPVQVEQILMNLVMNARDAMPKGGRLTIATRPARPDDWPEGATATTNMVAIAVSDTGIGIDEATRAQLFEPFFTTKPVGKGTGLGLATVYGLVTQNGGQITIHSRPGEGATFTVLLPAAELANRRAPAVRAAGSKGRVFVVEDEDDIRRMIGRVLRAEGYEVCEAADGEEALEMARGTDGIDLVVTDVVMPLVSGPELVAALRSMAPMLKVVFISGHTFDRLDIDALDAKVDRFLPKPFTPTDLRKTIAELMIAVNEPRSLRRSSRHASSRSSWGSTDR